MRQSPANGVLQPPTHAHSRSPTPSLRFCARRLSTCIVALSSTSIVTALLATRLNRRRFRIHPLPYLSDTGLYDPERIIVSLGLCISAALFIPLALAHHLHQRSQLVEARGKSALRVPLMRPVPAAQVARFGLLAGFILAAALAIFTAVPGWYLPHHVFAAVFAIAAAVWSMSIAAFDGAVSGGEITNAQMRVVGALGALQMAIVVVFSVVWGSVISGIPWKMKANKDFRFVILAVLEYVGTSAFLFVIRIVGVRLGDQLIVLALAPKDNSRYMFRSASCAGIV